MTRDEVHFLRTGDGVTLTLIRVRRDDAPTRGPVLLVHGAGMRAESFRPRGVRTLVDALLNDGHDAWMLNWRGSIDLDPLPWTLDDVALHDLPAAVRHILEETDAASLRIVAHCAGAAAASMASVAGLLPEVDVIVANGVSLHPVVPPAARAKLRILRPLMSGRHPFIDIAWGDGPEKGAPRLTRTLVRAWHVECGNGTCNMASFALGAGHPALWRHANLAPTTHDWLQSEFGKVPMAYYAQLAASERAGQFVALADDPRLPRRFADAPPVGQARFALYAGAHGRAFLPAAQRASLAFLQRHQPERHTLRELPHYGFADVFLGARAHADVFPRILADLAA